MNVNVIPQELRSKPQWVTWRSIPDGRRPDRYKKVPFNPHNGKPADSTNAQTWADFETALEAARKLQHDGIGYVFTGNDATFGGDLDDCIVDGTIAPWAQAIIDQMATYTEVSPSGNGVKFFGLGNLPENIKRFGPRIPESIKPIDAPGGIELYHVGRYFTVTGQHVPGTPTTLRNVNGALARLVAALAPAEPSHTAEPTARATGTDDEYLTVWAERLIERACETLRMAPDGSLHDTRLAMARLVGGLLPLRLATVDELARRLYDARVPNAHHKTEREAIYDGLAMGEQKPLEPPPPPPQPLFDADGWACCPVHKTRLPAAKNGNGYKCHEKDASTATGWCDFWWKGKGYIQPQTASTAEPVIIAGELITQTPIASMEAAPVPRFTLYKMSGLRGLPPVSWLIDGEIPAGLTTIICGPSGSGKSFLALDYVLRVARIFPDRAVVYIAPEGGAGYRARVDAWLQRFGGVEPENLFFLLQAVPLLDPRAVSEFITVIRPLNPVMVIVDTLARCLVGGDENSAKDVGMFFYYTDMIRQETGAAITIVHHTGKAGAYRGSSALIGAVDSWIDVANDDGLITISCVKAKDAQPFPPRYLRMVESGESVVLLPSDQVSQRNGKLTEGQRKTLETLALDIFTEPGAKRAELVSATSINDVTMYKILSRLKRDGLISQSKKGDPYFITTEGLAAIKNYHRDLRQQREQLSNYPATINQLSDDTSSQLSNYHSLFIKRESDSSVEDDSSDSGELFEDDDPQPTETVADPVVESTAPPARAVGAAAGGLDWDYLRKQFAAQNYAGISTHVGMRRGDLDAVLAQLESEAK